MSVHLYVAPAAAGKTAYAAARAQQAAHQLDCMPLVWVEGALQVQAFQRRLASRGGALGVRVVTRGALWQACLERAGESAALMHEVVRRRLLADVIERLSLRRYAPLAQSTGFARALDLLIAQLGEWRVTPQQLADAVGAAGDERLRDLADIYQAYARELRALGLVDLAGLGETALRALEHVPADGEPLWPLLIVDGIARWTPLSVETVAKLAPRVGEMVVLLQGESPAAGDARPEAHGPAYRALGALERALGARAEALPETIVDGPAASLAHVQACLHGPPAEPAPDDGALMMLAAPDRVAEVREALRWLKQRVVIDGVPVSRVALLCRDLAPYRQALLQVASEFGLPLRVVGGLPLAGNPLIASVMALLRAMLPVGGSGPELAPRSLVDAWRSPYLHWGARAAPEDEPIGIVAGDAEALDAVARYAQVVRGAAQWREALEALAALGDEEPDDPELRVAPNVPRGAAAAALASKLERFLGRLTPPQGARTLRAHVAWLERLIGPWPADDGQVADDLEGYSLGVARCAQEDPTTGPRDLAALRSLRAVLRGLVFAEERLAARRGEGAPVSYARFLSELSAAVGAESYAYDPQPGAAGILVADVESATGLQFDAVAVLGLAEGEFPRALSDDPLLPERDRVMLAAQGLALPEAIRAEEAYLYYVAATRARHRLLLTRPRLADNGAAWEPSPYWEETARLVEVAPMHRGGTALPAVEEVASVAELVLLAASGIPLSSQMHTAPELGWRLERLDHAQTVIAHRQRGGVSVYDGDLSELRRELAQRLGAGFVWSASQLEAYQTCPFLYLVSILWHLEQREPPKEGPNLSHLGLIYHRILEAVYTEPAVSDPADLEQLLAALPRAAAEILDGAPQRLGFRETVWWQHTRRDIVADVERTLRALAGFSEGWEPCGHELRFTRDACLVLPAEDEGEPPIRVRGVIDRLDRRNEGDDEAGLRVIDYKTSGPSGYGPRELERGKRLQVALYALAAERALGLGRVVDGCYWHVRQAEPSRLQLARYGGGVAAALEAAERHVRDAVSAARAGAFPPTPPPPSQGCPGYCPAADFCWHYTRRIG